MKRNPKKIAALEQRVIESQRRHDRKQVMKRNQKRMRRRRRVFALFTLALLCAAGYGGYTLLRRTFFNAQFEELPMLREQANQAALGELLPSDTTGRPLTAAEKTADARQLQALLKKIPASLSPTDGDALKVTLDNLVARAEKTASDQEFFRVLQEMVKAAGTPTSAMLLPNDYTNLCRNLGSGFYAADSPYSLALSDERVAARYARFRKETEKPNSVAKAENFVQPTMQVDTTTDTAILSHLAFEDGAYRTQKEELARLLKEARTHKQVLFDLRNTHGTSVEYWAEGILPYLTTSTFGAETQLFFPNGFDDYVDYLSLKERMESFDLEDERRSVTGLKNEETQNAVNDMAYAKTLTITTKGNTETLAPANVVLLVDETTGGAAETFADFCQRLQNVKVVGRKTEGSGWKIPAFPVKLLHSGFIALLDPILALAPEGESLQTKTGVQPDKTTNERDLLSFALKTLR